MRFDFCSTVDLGKVGAVFDPLRVHDVRETQGWHDVDREICVSARSIQKTSKADK